MKYILILLLFPMLLSAQSDSTKVKELQFQVEYLQKTVTALKQELMQYQPYTNDLRSPFSYIPNPTPNKLNQSIMIDIGHIGNLFYTDIKSENAFNQFRVGIGYSRRLSKEHLFWYIRGSTDLNFKYHSFNWGYQIMF